MAFALYQLRVWQTIKIEGVVYTVRGMVEFRHGSYRWKEYALSADDRRNFRLTVEGDETAPLCSLLRRVEFDFVPEDSVVYAGKTCVRHDSGRADVCAATGIPNLRTGDRMEFSDYRGDDGVLLSRRERNGVAECWTGTEVSAKQIFPDDNLMDAMPVQSSTLNATTAPGALPYAKLSSLPVDQGLRINATEYRVRGYARYRQKMNSFTWIEYKIGPAEWLCVEQSGEGYALSLHKNVPLSKVSLRPGHTAAEYLGVVYERVEAGRGNVIASGGDVDFDSNEPFTFEEYRSPSGDILTFEHWEDEEEVSLGSEIHPSSLTLTDLERPSLLRSVRGRRRGRPWVVAGFVCLQIILGLLTYWYNSGPCIERQLAASGSFRHETSVTLPGGRKAQVYSTALTPDQACQAIIQMDPERIRYVTMALKDNSDTDADSDKTPDLARSERMLQTDRETVMIYESETSATFVQVSAADARENRYTAYRPRWPSRTYNLYRASRAWYGNAERATVNPANTYNIDTGRYSSIVGSARQASISARRSTGGGSHFGK